jgi:hypothetical protein
MHAMRTMLKKPLNLFRVMWGFYFLQHTKGNKLISFNVETLQAFGALFQIPHYYRKFSHCKLKMLFYILLKNVLISAITQFNLLS